MKFSFEIGQREKHLVDFYWGAFFGVAKIWVDEILVLKSRPQAMDDLSQLARMQAPLGSVKYVIGMANGSMRPALITGWTIDVGDEERHCVVIEKQRPLFLGALRKNTYRVFVDGTLLIEHWTYPMFVGAHKLIVRRFRWQSVVLSRMNLSVKLWNWSLAKA